MINGQPSRTKERMLRQNGIQYRYYALDKQQKSLYSVSEMAALAIEDCLKYTTVQKNEIDILAAATTQGDLTVPGLASMIQAEAGLGATEIATLHGVCGSSIMAMKYGWLNVASGLKKNALVCASEFPSRMFKSSRFENQEGVLKNGNLPLETDFLRWMLSDGAGALLIQSQPSEHQVSFEIEYIDIQSYASYYDVCMFSGMDKVNGSSRYWIDYDDFQQADKAGAINLKQDLKLVHNIVKLGVQRFFELIEAQKIDPTAIDYLLCHYSSHFFKGQILELLEKGGLHIPEEKWFTNLYHKGNTGSASIFIMLEELVREKKLRAGQKIVCMVPESGRFLTAFMVLTVVEPKRDARTYFTEINPPAIQITGGQVQEWLVRQLTNVWIDFETRLNKVPVIDKINRGMLTRDEYMELLFNIRQQVIDGSQWIARAASNVSMKYFDVRSSFIRHSGDEHRDYQILEKNYINMGGSLEDIRNGQKNLGSEALSAYMFQRASQPDPFDLLGGMFIIEGLGNRLAGKWGRAIKEQLGLRDDQVSFLIYHESSDASDNHFERFEKAVKSDLLTKEIAERIVKTARVVARLYTMQLEEIGKY
jgi:3-oxoacyl-[acyl-carrier-protein] synthase-3